MSNKEQTDQNVDANVEQEGENAELQAEDSVSEGEASAETEEVAGEEVTLKRLEELQEQVATYQDQALRATAEQQNIRRRAERDVENAHKFALEKFGADLLPVIDNLERAILAADPENEHLKSYIEGVELTRKTLVDVLKKHGIEQIDPHGEPFDPQYHQAITMLENPDVEPNSVIEVMQKGYILNGRLIRPAMVVVAKSAPKVDMNA